MFPRLSYLEWMDRRASVAPYDLGSSGLVGDEPDDFVLEPATLADLADPPAGATVENLVAQHYGVNPDQVLVTAGATHANVIAYATALGMADGSKVLVEAPAYEPLLGTPVGLGATVEQFDRAPDGALEPADVEDAIDGETAVVTISNRHNPSGYLLDRAALAELSEVAADADVPLLVDEVYAPYVLEPGDGPFGGPSAVDLPNAVVTGSLTKFFGLGSLRIGWLVGSPEFVEAAGHVAPHLPDVAGPSRVLARRALAAAEDLAADQRSLLAENHRALAEFVASRDDVDGPVHEGSSFGFFEPTAVSPMDLGAAAWEEGVLVVPGRFYGDPNRMRVSAGRSPTDVAVSLERFGQVLTDVGRAP